MFEAPLMAPGHQYEFGRFRLDAGGRLLFRDGDRVPLTPKAVDILTALVENSGATVTRQDLLAKIWSDVAVEEGTLSSHISLLRKTLGPQFIETIPKRGYRFIGTVKAAGGHDVARPRRILLAVLPFENLDGSDRYDAFSEGLTEELITQLGRINPDRLGVIARTSSMTYKSTNKTIERIGRELNVSHVLEGSARRGGGRIRRAAQPIQVSDQTHLWSASYEADVEDVLTLQSRVARAVADQIQIKLQVGEETRRVVPAAYEAFSRGRYLWNRRGEQDLQNSLHCFEEAIRNDPTYGAAYAGMADAYLTLMDHGYLSPTEGSARAREVLETALNLDATLAEAHVALGHAAFHEFDWATAERGFQRGLELNPNYSIEHHYYANYLAAMGQAERAIEEAEHARQLDPVSPAAQSNLTSILWLARQHERSLEESKRLLELAPEMAGGYEDLGRNFEATGELDQAEKAFLRAAELTHDSPGSLASLGHFYGRAGRREEALAMLQKLEAVSRTTYVSPYAFGLVCLGLDLLDDAFRWLDKAYDERSSALPFLNVNPRFDRVRSDPRLQTLTARLRLPCPQ
jgi:TolB-like protein/Tfp pilus assembly protein PilF